MSELPEKSSTLTSSASSMGERKYAVAALHITRLIMQIALCSARIAALSLTRLKRCINWQVIANGLTAN